MFHKKTHDVISTCTYIEKIFIHFMFLANVSTFLEAMDDQGANHWQKHKGKCESSPYRIIIPETNQNHHHTNYILFESLNVHEFHKNQQIRRKSGTGDRAAEGEFNVTQVKIVFLIIIVMQIIQIWVCCLKNTFKMVSFYLN